MECECKLKKHVTELKVSLSVFQPLEMLEVVRRSTEPKAIFEKRSSLGVNNQLKYCV